MTAPCSAYCRPDEGVHVFLSAARRPGTPVTIDDARGYSVGRAVILTGDECIPAGASIVVLGIEPAPEAPPFPGWDVTFLETVQVLS